MGALERVTGEALFAGDMHMEGAVTLVALRSDRPHARIVNIDLARALETRGRLRVFTVDDIPGRNRLGIINKDQHLLADQKVRCVGDPIALVAAETPEAAERAVESIAVLYEDAPAVFDAGRGFKTGRTLDSRKREFAWETCGKTRQSGRCFQGSGCGSGAGLYHPTHRTHVP